jgi:hypothetical protein
MLKRLLKMLLLGVIYTSFLGTTTVWAQDAAYEVKAVPSTAQVDESKTYFDLRLKPEEHHTITVMVSNRSDKSVTVNTDVKTATTNTNGVVEYMNSEQNKSVELPYKLSQLVQPATKKITLAPHESRNVEYQITMPKQAFSGILSGGLIFTSEDEENSKAANTDVTIKNQFGYVIALVLHGQKEVTSDLQLKSIHLGQINHRNVVFAQLMNPKAAYLNRLNVTAKIKKKNTSTILYETKKDNLQMAPNSQFDYPISLQETNFKPGKYTLSIQAESKGRTWNFEEEFEIKAKEAKKMNKHAYIRKDLIDYGWYALLLLFLLIILVIIVYRRRREKIKQLEEQIEILKGK